MLLLPETEKDFTKPSSATEFAVMLKCPLYFSISMISFSKFIVVLNLFRPTVPEALKEILSASASKNFA